MSCWVLLVIHIFFLLMTLNIWCHTLLACRVSVEKSAHNLMGVSSCVTFCFSLAGFNILSLSLIFCHFNYNVSWCRSVWVHLVCDYYASWTQMFASFLRLRQFLAIPSSSKLSFAFSLSSPYRIPKMCLLVYLMFSLRSLTVIFFFFLFSLGDFYYSVFQFTNLFLCVI